MKKSTKKAISLLLAVVLIISLCGCGGGNAHLQSSSTVTQQSSSQHTSAEVSSHLSGGESSSENSMPIFSMNGLLGAITGIFNPSNNTSSKVSSASSVTSSKVSGASSVTSSKVSSASSAVTSSKEEPKPDPRYTFDGSISLEVLNNYLNRAMTYCQILRGDENFADIKNDIIGVGAKYIQRAACNWPPLSWEHQIASSTKSRIATIHAQDPDIIFEACIFECITKSLEKIAIPASTFEAFGLPYEERNFDYESMLFPDGTYVNHWGTDSSVPDITRLETQMFIYMRGCFFIDQGFEALHLGQTNMVGKNDANNAIWAKIIGMIRDYAKKNARRHYVIINCHNPSQNFVDKKGNMLVDFNAFPMRISVAPGQTDHKATESNPQLCVITPGVGNAVYKKNIKGTSPSGWTTDKYPYLVEVDNWGISSQKYLDKASSYIWGYDEITWFAMQPQWYRQKFIEDLTKQIDSFNENGHLAIPGKRWIGVVPGGNGSSCYFAASKTGNVNYYGDLEFYRDLWNRLGK